MDKQWKKSADFFVHKVSTGHGLGVHELLAKKLVLKSLIILLIIKLCTAILALNNNNKLTISNIY